jgi:hypothetical protein
MIEVRVRSSYVTTLELALRRERRRAPSVTIGTINRKCMILLECKHSDTPILFL